MNDTPNSVSPTAPLPGGSGESAGATVSAAVAPAAPVAAPIEPATIAPSVASPQTTNAVTSDAATSSPEPAASALSHEFAPSLFEAPAETPAASEAPKPEDAKPETAPEAPKPEDAKPETPVEPAPPPEPIAYEFKFPENVDPQAIDKTVVEKYTGILNKGRVDPAVAQEALDLHLEQVQSIGKRLADLQWDVFNKQQENWKTQAKGDPEIGGSRMMTAQRNAARFMEGMGLAPKQIQGIMDVMKTTGAGNYPDLFRLFARAGDRFFKEGEARNMPPARQVPLSREDKQKARYK